MLATSQASRCTHWMHAGWWPSPAGALGEIRPQVRRMRFRIGLQIARLPRGHGFCWRRSRRVPFLTRNGRAAAVGRGGAGAVEVGAAGAEPAVGARGEAVAV